MQPDAARKGIIIILDGLGDRPVASLGDRTPLEAANTPNLNALASRGRWGLAAPIPEGEQAHTHIGVGSLFAMESEGVQALTRGPVEAAGAGLDLDDGDVAMRLNFATVQPFGDGFRVLDRRAGRITSGTEDLAAQLNGLELASGIRVFVQTTEQHRGALRLSGPGLSSAIGDTDPGSIDLPGAMPTCQPTDQQAASQYTANLVNRLMSEAHEVLRNHPLNLNREAEGLLPANGIVVRGAGSRPSVQSSLTSDYRVAVIAGCSTVRGMSRLAGFNVVHDRSFTADEDTNLAGKIKAVTLALEGHDLVYLHIKAPDILAHDCRAQDKLEFLEKVDQSLEYLMPLGAVIAVCADHGTDSNEGRHINEPVPALIADGRRVSDDVSVNFGETECATGPLGTIGGPQFVREVLDSLT